MSFFSLEEENKDPPRLCYKWIFTWTFNCPITYQVCFQMLTGMLKATFVLTNLRITSVWR